MQMYLVMSYIWFIIFNPSPLYATRLEYETTVPTMSSTQAPTATLTAAPTTAPTSTPTAPPTFTLLTNSPTLSPTVRPTTTTSTHSPTQSPTRSPTTATTLNNSKNIVSSPVGVIVGGGLGGGCAVLAIVFGIRRASNYRKRKSLEQVWTPSEEGKFAEIFNMTHDFEKLCQAVPNRSRESVARKAKLLLSSESKNGQTAQQLAQYNTWISKTYIQPQKRYAFVSERRNNKISFFSSKLSQWYHQPSSHNTPNQQQQTQLSAKNPAFHFDNYKSASYPSY